MKSDNRLSLVGIMLACLLLIFTMLGCGGANQTEPPPPPISVSVSQSSAMVAPLGTLQVTATVANDPNGKGVNWTVSCSGGSCGNVLPTATLSGAATTYTAPNVSVTAMLTATSVADPTKSANVNITVSGVVVTVSPSSTTVEAGATAKFTATVVNDSAAKGVTWTVSCSAATCGSVSPISTASGAATTYTAPSNPPPGVLTVAVTAASVTDTSKTASASVTTSSIAVSISPNGVSVDSGGTQQFTATVANDPSNGGVTWSVVRTSCLPFRGCGLHPCSSCGTVSPAATASGAPVTYTAPAAPPSGAVLLQATSVAFSGASSSGSLTVLPISVSVSPSPVSVVLSETQQFAATVTNDGTNSGVTWSLTQNGVACSPGCGTISPTSTASGAVAAYTAPTTAPALPVVSVTAKSVEDTTKSGVTNAMLTTSTGALACNAGTGDESLLKGQYALVLQGSAPNDQVVMAGSFTADGTGKITAGEIDAARWIGPQETDVSINASSSGYAVGPDHRGCLVLADATGQTPILRFALGSLNPGNIATIGDVIEVDDESGSGAPVAGTIRLQDATSFTANQFKGAYAYGVFGVSSGGRVAMAGTFTSDGISALTSSDLDINMAGQLTSNQSSSPGGNFTCCSANGRGTLTLSDPNAPSSLSSFVIYMINSGDSFLLALGVAGEAMGIPSGTSFTQASLNGSAVLRGSGYSSTGPIVDIATVSADGKTALTTDDNINNAGTFTSSSTALNYNVASNGRVAFTGGGTPPVMYLYGVNQGFLVSTDANAIFSILEPQAAGSFSDASFSGALIFGTEGSSSSAVTIESGVLAANGQGNASGTSDQSNSTGFAQNQALNFMYSISANGAGNVGSGTTAILISGNKLVFINNTNPNPTITVVEQ
jgi:hypothetical protein